MNDTSYIAQVSEWLQNHNGAITAVATISIAGFTWALASSTRKLWAEAKRSSEIAEQALIAGGRAFVFAMGIQHFWELDQESGLYNWRFRPQWHNSGDTPTKNLVMHTECQLLDEPLPQGFDFAYETTEIGNGLIPPKSTSMGGIAPRAPNPAITPQDILDIQAGRKYLYMWGWAKYSDVFHDEPKHITRFCWFIVPMGNPMQFIPAELPGGNDIMKFDWIHHMEGNSAD